MVSIFTVDHEGVCGILAFGDASQHQSVWKIRRQILQGVNGDLSPAHEHLGFEFFGEQALVSDFGEGHVENFVALSGHGFH